MKEFNIEEINIQKKNQEEDYDLADLLTGEYMKGLDKNSLVKPNAELEGDEYVQFPNGDVMKIKGPDHEQGGVDTNIPDGTKIVSKSLYLTGPQAKRLEKITGYKFSVKDSYAKAIDKFVNKIGLEELYEQQEDYIKKVEDISKDDKMDENTKRINLGFLGEKINEIEKAKQPLEKEKMNFFSRVFDMQEIEKGASGNPDNFKFGGISSKNISKVAEKLGLGEDVVTAVINKNTPKFPDGGKFSSKARPNTFSSLQREYQHSNKTTYGQEKDPDTILANLYYNFPDIIGSQEGIGQYLDQESLAKGVVKFKGGLDLGKEQQLILDMQEKVDARMKQSAETIIANPELFDEQTFKLAEEYKKKETFSGRYDKSAELESRVRAYDSKLGDFTSGRFALGLDLVTPEEQKSLKNMGITTLNQITPETMKNLSPATQDKLNKIKEVQKDNSDFFLDTYTPENAQPETVETRDTGKGVNNPDPTAGLTDFMADFQVKKENPKMFYMPENRPLPPSALQVGTMIDNQLQRMDPVRIGIDQNLQEAATTISSISNQLSDLPPSQRAASLAALMATTQDGINKAIVDVNRTNAQNQAETELFNINQATSEEQARSQNILSFEQRALTAQAKTEEDIRNYYDYNRKVALNNFQNQQQLNLLDQMTPDYDLNFFGTGVEYNPSYFYQLYDERNPVPSNYNDVQPDDLTKKALVERELARNSAVTNAMMEYYKSQNK